MNFCFGYTLFYLFFIKLLYISLDTVIEGLNLG